MHEKESARAGLWERRKVAEKNLEAPCLEKIT